MKKLTSLVTILVLILVASVFSREVYLDIIYLKNNTTVKGEIVELVVGEYVKVKLLNGIVNTYPMKDILKIEKSTKSIEVQDKKDPKKIKKENSTLPIEKPKLPEKTRTPKPPGYKSPGLAFLLSFIVIGGGQVYNEEPGKAVAQLAIVLSGVALIAADGDSKRNSGDEINLSDYAGGILIFTGAVWSLIDAPVSASNKNRKLCENYYGHTLEFETDGHVVGVDLGYVDRSLGGKVTLHF